MNNKNVAKAPKVTTTNTTASTAAQSNGRRVRPPHKSIEEPKTTKLVKTQSSTVQKDKMVQKKKDAPAEAIKEAVIGRDDDRRRAERRSNAPLQKQATVTTNDAKRVPKSNGSVSRESKSLPKSKESAYKTKTIQSKPAAKPVSVKRVTVPVRTTRMVIAKPTVAATVSPQNVMNKVHNVTVSSPPAMRRDSREDKVKSRSEKTDVVVARDRMRTRTLDKSEVILLKPKDESTASMETPSPMRIDTSNGSSASQRINVEIRQPVSFEVNFDDEKRKQNNKSPTLVSDDDMAESYEDDFESYESDFEENLSSSEASETQQSHRTERNSSSVGDKSSSESEVGDGSPNAKHPFDVNKMDEELDSGSFEMKPISSARTPRNEKLDVEPQQTWPVTMQHDSGIEVLPGAGSNHLNNSGGPFSSLDINNSKTSDNISDIETEIAVNSLEVAANTSGIKRKNLHSDKVAKLNRRGAELLKKITLDTMNYVLYDCQPIPYDLFMQIYGRNNTAQVSIQTHNTRIDQDTQLDPVDLADVWTQHPPTFFTRHMFANDFSAYKNGCSARSNHDETSTSPLTDCVKQLQKYTMPIRANVNEATHCEINYERLNRFLLSNEITISRLINDKNNNGPTQLNDSIIPDSLGYFAIDLEMPEFEVLRIFASPALPGFLFTLHHEIRGHLYLIGVWNLANAKKPFCLLSSWTAVLCMDIHASARDLVFAGLDDGSIAVWDYVEAKYRHPILTMDDTIKRFVPSQVVTPAVENSGVEGVADIGHVIAIRSLHAGADVELLNGYDPMQICSLHDTGLLVLWSVLETSATTLNIELTEKRIDHQSEWSNVKLIQNKLIDLRPHAQSSTHFRQSRPTSSSFDKTRSYFESDLFEDAALQELQSTNQMYRKCSTNFRCVALELTRDGILIATNENCILFGRKTMRSETFHKLQIDTVDHNGRIDALLALALFEDDVVLAALRDGTIKSFCYDRRARKSDPLSDCGDESSIPSAYSLPPMPPASDGQMSASSSISAASTGAFMIGHDMGKSCTIQSIVQCERKLYDEVHALNNLDMNEYKTLSDEEDVDRNALKFTRFVNDQIVMSSSLDHSARRQMIQLIKSNRLVILHHGLLRLFNFRNNEISPINSNTGVKWVEAASTVGDNGFEYLILLDGNNGIQVHICVNNIKS